jgi:plasmid stabilization system protein ParE
VIAYKVVFAASAKEDLENILSYIGEDSIENAIQFVEKLSSKLIKTLSIAPQSGTLLRIRMECEVRSLVLHKSYTAFYIVNEDDKQAEVISIFNTYKDNQEFWLELKSQGIIRFPRK